MKKIKAYLLVDGLGKSSAEKYGLAAAFPSAIGVKPQFDCAADAAIARRRRIRPVLFCRKAFAVRKIRLPEILLRRGAAPEVPVQYAGGKKVHFGRTG